MPVNLEIKSRIPHLAPAAATARALGAADMGVLRQTDTYFLVPNGRLKLRETEGRGAELIFYERDESGPERLSRFTVMPVEEPEPLRRSLAAALGTRGVVAKTRRLFMAGSTRIHLDEVEGLGAHIEFEVPVEGDPADAEATIRRLEREFGIEGGSCWQGSYIDLLESKRPRIP